MRPCGTHARDRGSSEDLILNESMLFDMKQPILRVNQMHWLSSMHLGVPATSVVWSRSILGSLVEVSSETPPSRPARMADISYTC